MAPDDDRTQAVTVLSKGTVIGHYRIVEKIGAGDTGGVYLQWTRSCIMKTERKLDCYS